MPIRPEHRKHYGKHWRTVVRPAILKRSGNKCEFCGKPDRKRVWVVRGPGPIMGQCWSFTRTHTMRKWISCLSGFCLWDTRLNVAAARRIRVVLTVAHLNHTPGDDDPDNLKALCQWCHLNYDKLHHHESRAARKDSARPLLA